MSPLRLRATSFLWPAIFGVGAGIHEALGYPEGDVALVGFLIATVVWTLVLFVTWELWDLPERAAELSIAEVFGRVSVPVLVGRVLVTSALIGIAGLLVEFVVQGLTTLVLS